MAKKQCVDHLGNIFESESARAEYYKKPVSTINNRLSRNWTLEQALTTDNKTNFRKINNTPKKIWKDHEGNEYNSVRELCEAYYDISGITEKVFWGRKRALKWPLEKILLTPVNDVNYAANAQQVTDHLGQTWPSISEMCRHWGVKQQTYRMRIRMGFTVEDALTAPIKKINTAKQQWTDHNGITYPSLNAMCKAHGTTRTRFSTRVNDLGWSVEKALTTKEVIVNRKPIRYGDLTFPSAADAANYYGVPVYRFQGKKLGNYDVIPDEYMEKIMKSTYNGKDVNDIHVIGCIKYPYFMVSVKNNKYVWHIDSILKEYHKTFDPIPKTKIQDKHLRIIECIDFPYYKITYDDAELIWSYWQIIKYRAESNFGLSN